MYEISLRNFRGFHSVGFVPVRPLTILLGENSAGKSSFLAGLKYLLTFFPARRNRPLTRTPSNSEPSSRYPTTEAEGRASS